MKSLVLWEFSRKQNYVFKSNKLKECIGASMIIRKLSEDFSKYNLKDENFIIKGGGKSLYLFDDKKQGDKFIRDFSIEIIKSYPGLEFFIVKETIDISNQNIKTAIKNIYRKLEIKKSIRKNSGNQIGFGIERKCESTGYPASASFFEDGIKKFISSEIKAKRDEEENDIKEYFDDLIPQGYGYSKKIDDLVNEKTKRYISVIHIDGNRMGKKLRSLGNKIVKNSDETTEHYNKRYIDTLRKFSYKIDESYKSAFRNMSQKIVDAREDLEDISKISDKIIPLRPLIFAGDDVTYLTNAYIGVETAETFLEELEKNSIKINDIDFGKLHACAGIAIIKKGYPFIKGYDAAEQLCYNSKKAIIERDYEDTSVLDFHIYQGDINESIYDIRKDQYSFDGEHIKLTMKPLVVDSSVDWRNYENFITSLDNINKAVCNKKIGRNKVKNLREILKKGEDETKYFFKFYNIAPDKYFRDFQGASGSYCFNESDNICMYLDAIESMDMFRKLKNEVKLK
jgi:hypothetical protein